MSKEDLIKSLLRLHCINCTGTLFGCRGCTKKEEIKVILNTTEKEIEYIKEIQEAKKELKKRATKK